MAVVHGVHDPYHASDQEIIELGATEKNAQTGHTANQGHSAQPLSG